MNIIEYDDADLDFEESSQDSYFSTGISGFEIAYGSGNKTSIRKTTKIKLHTKKKLDMLHERRRLTKDTNTLYDEWF